MVDVTNPFFNRNQNERRPASITKEKLINPFIMTSTMKKMFAEHVENYFFIIDLIPLLKKE